MARRLTSSSVAARSPWKTSIGSAVATISYSYDPCDKRQTAHLAIFSSFQPSSSPSPSSSSIQPLPKKSLENGRAHDENLLIVDYDDAPTQRSKGNRKLAAIRSRCSLKVVPVRSKKRPSLWKFLFGSKKFRSIILLNIITFVYASDIPVLKEVETFMDPAAFCAVRFALSAVPFLPFVFRARNDLQTRNAGMELGLWVSLGYLVEAVGLLTSDAGRASFISMFTVIVVPLLESVLGSIVPARVWFGILMSALGVAMLECSGSPPSVGDLLNFLSAIFFGIHMLRTEHISRSMNKENFLPLLGYEVCVVALLSTIWYVIGGWSDGIQDYGKVSWEMLWDWMVVFPWIPALYTGVFSTGLCLWAEIAAMRDVSATETAIIYGLEPLWGAAFAWFLLGERWGVVGWIGAALALGGSLTVQICGSSPGKSGEVRVNSEQSDLLMVSSKRKQQNPLSTSPVVVSSREDVIDLFQK